MSPTVVPSRPGTPQPPTPPLPPHVPVTGERQWQLIARSQVANVEVAARDHRWKLINGAAADRRYLVLGSDGLHLTANPPVPTPGGGVGWQTELTPADPRYRGALRYEQNLSLFVSMASAGQRAHGYVSTQQSGGPVIAQIHGTQQIHPLELSNRAHDEWQVRGRTAGEVWHVGEWFGLYNTRLRDYVVLLPGADGAAAGLQTWQRASASGQFDFSLRLQPNIPYQGVICWYGRFPLDGSAMDAHLSGLHVPRLHSFPVVYDFWCGARRKFDVRVPEDSSMTAAQMTDVFGSATPGLPVQMWVVIEAAQNVNVDSAVVNLDYAV